MAGNKRLLKEYSDLLKANNDYLRNLVVSEADMFNWKLTILPQNEPYKNGAFKIEVNFPGKNESTNRASLALSFR